MKLPTATETVFAVKCYAAAMAALYLAYSIGLTRPFWAMTTVYIVSQPLAGAVRSKAVFRLVGTFVGATVAIATIPTLSNYPVLVVAFLSLWIGLCLYFGVLDRTPRSYLFMLAGYTVSLVGLSSIAAPGDIFDLALARVEEISLGILCATLVHSLILPRGLAQAVIARLDATVADARTWMQIVLGGDTGGKTAKERHVLANDISLLRQLSTHVPFDTSNIRWTVQPLNLIQDQIAAITAVVSAIEDRLLALREAGHELPAPVAQALTDVSAWLAQGRKADPAQAGELRRRLAGLMPVIEPGLHWEDALLVSLLARLRELIHTFRRCVDLRQDIQASLEKARARAPRRPRARGACLHGDHPLALWSAITTTLTIATCCTVWILTAWPYGSTAAIMASVFGALYSSLDNPAASIKNFMKFILASMPVSALYLLVVMPMIDTFDMMALSFFPALFVMGVLMARPAYTAKATPIVIGFCGTLALYDYTSVSNQVAFFEFSVSQAMGLGIATIIAAIFRNARPAWRARRIQAANWNELARLASSSGSRAGHVYATRMLDRVSLLQMRLAAADRAASDTLLDLRVGRDITELQRARRRLPAAETAIGGVLQGLARYYRGRSAGRHAQPPELLAQIDATLAGIVTHGGLSQARTRATVALVGIRRDLYPGTVSPAGIGLQASPA